MNLPQQLVTDLLALSERERYELACILMDSIGEDLDEMDDEDVPHSMVRSMSPRPTCSRPGSEPPRT